MAENNMEPEKLRPLPSFKISERTPESVKRALEEVEKTFARARKVATVHRTAIEEARKGEEHFDMADAVENTAQDISRKSRKNPLYVKTPNK